ncbi:uncharacterized protein DUF4177 [Paenibacillus sp. BK033]|uniref:DUF4177 domain-containing protein n=1 Tax=Paenibacillus sp. BK033 TaxID=2512133 RepID=UPI0010511174|nr:DUF4177 domain-containing protein [Paenibacillus sp. BK033]TCM89668.1 uncharacterized protein DUF4177 [Paenibacillus sp. BK033]
MADRFEYQTISFARKGVFKAKFNPDEELNRLGAEGWELVAMYTAGAGVGSSDELFATFKRRVG